VMKFAQNCGSAFDWFTDMYGIDDLHDVHVAFWPEGAAKFKADALPSFEAANALSTQWRDCVLRYEWGHVVTNGYDYPIPQEPQRNVCQPLREYGSAITNQYLCPDFEINPEQIAALYDSISLIDPENHATASPIHLLSGYWSLKLSEM